MLQAIDESHETLDVNQCKTYRHIKVDINE